MSRKFIPVEEAFREWKRDPQFRAAYDALEEEFALGSVLIDACERPILDADEIAAQPASGHPGESEMELIEDDQGMSIVLRGRLAGRREIAEYAPP